MSRSMSRASWLRSEAEFSRQRHRAAMRYDRLMRGPGVERNNHRRAARSAPDHRHDAQGTGRTWRVWNALRLIVDSEPICRTSRAPMRCSNRVVRKSVAHIAQLLPTAGFRHPTSRSPSLSNSSPIPVAIEGDEYRVTASPSNAPKLSGWKSPVGTGERITPFPRIWSCQLHRISHLPHPRCALSTSKRRPLRE